MAGGGGQLFVHEFLLDADRTRPLTAALFAVHMLVMTAGGRAYSGAEVAGWLRECGLVDVGEVGGVVGDERDVVRGAEGGGRGLCGERGEQERGKEDGVHG